MLHCQYYYQEYLAGFQGASKCPPERHRIPSVLEVNRFIIVAVCEAGRLFGKKKKKEEKKPLHFTSSE